METASFTGLLRTYSGLFLFTTLLKFLMRLLAPYLFQQVVKKAEQNFKQQQQNYQQTINNIRNKTNSRLPKNEMPREKKKVGEYIDFEEIE